MASLQHIHADLLKLAHRFTLYRTNLAYTIYINNLVHAVPVFGENFHVSSNIPCWFLCMTFDLSKAYTGSL